MRRIATLVVFIVLNLASNAIAVDLSGEVSLPDGTPVCALVLANGQSVFSCQPSGPFSFTDLPVREDGIVTLQVYASGLQPFKERFTDTPFKSVVMERAGVCPVDEGLPADSLVGTYELIRSTLLFSDENLFDSADSQITVTGEMSISEDQITQTLSILVDGQGGNATGTFDYTDLGFAAESEDARSGREGLFTIVERGRKLVTSSNATAYGGDFVELDYWRRVSRDPAAASASNEDVASSEPLDSTLTTANTGQEFESVTGIPGTLLGDIVRAAGISAPDLPDDDGPPPSGSTEQELTLTVSKDASIFADDIDASISNGSIFVGRNSRGSIRRGLVAFDLSAIPSGATINSVVLSVNITNFHQTGVEVSAHRLLSDWGEGENGILIEGGRPQTATPDDPTWMHRFFDALTWDRPGGDFVSTASATSPSDGNITWSGAGLRADVQDWVDDPASNFGWILIGDEVTAQSVQVLSSKETFSALAPSLVVAYTTRD